MFSKIKSLFTKNGEKKPKVKFFSKKANKMLKAEVIKENDKTLILKLPDGNIIKKKKKHLELLDG